MTWNTLSPSDHEANHPRSGNLTLGQCRWCVPTCDHSQVFQEDRPQDVAGLMLMVDIKAVVGGPQP